MIWSVLARSIWLWVMMPKLLNVVEEHKKDQARKGIEEQLDHDLYLGKILRMEKDTIVIECTSPNLTIGWYLQKNEVWRKAAGGKIKYARPQGLHSLEGLIPHFTRQILEWDLDAS